MITHEIMNVWSKIQKTFETKTFNWEENYISDIVLKPATSVFGYIDCSRIEIGQFNLLRDDVIEFYYMFDEEFDQYIFLMKCYELAAPIRSMPTIIRDKILIGVVNKQNLQKIIDQIEQLDFQCSELAESEHEFKGMY